MTTDITQLKPGQRRAALFPLADTSFGSSDELKQMSDTDLDALYQRVFGIRMADVEEYTTFNAANGKHLKYYQLRAIYGVLAKGAFGIIMKMGTGKTLSAVACAYWYKKFGISTKKALFLVPGQIAIGAILDDIATNTRLYACKFGTTVYDYGDTDIVVGTYAAFRRFLFSDMDNKPLKTDGRTNVATVAEKVAFVHNTFDCFIMDEYHSVKHEDTLLSRGIGTVLSQTDDIALRIGMTGTPMGDKVMDIYHQMLLLDDGVTFGSNPHLFRSRYMKGIIQPRRVWSATAKQYQYKDIEVFETNMDLLPEVKARAKRWMINYDSDEVLDLPPFKFLIHRYYLEGEALRCYGSLVKGEIFQVGTHTVVPSTPHQKQLQLCSGFLYRPDSTDYIRLPGTPPKARVAVEEIKNIFIRDSRAVVVLFYHYEASGDILVEALDKAGIRTITFGTSKSVVAIRKKLKTINESEGKLVILASIGSSGQSLNLQRAAYIVYYDIPVGVFNLGQSLYRIRRIGSAGNALEVHFLSGIMLDDKGEDIPGIEEHNLINLQQKNAVADNFYSYRQVTTKRTRPRWLDIDVFAPMMNYWTPETEADLEQEQTETVVSTKAVPVASTAIAQTLQQRLAAARAAAKGGERPKSLAPLFGTGTAQGAPTTSTGRLLADMLAAARNKNKDSS